MEYVVSVALSVRDIHRSLLVHRPIRLPFIPTPDIKLRLDIDGPIWTIHAKNIDGIVWNCELNRFEVHLEITLKQLGCLTMEEAQEYLQESGWSKGYISSTNG